MYHSSVAEKQIKQLSRNEIMSRQTLNKSFLFTILPNRDDDLFVNVFVVRNVLDNLCRGQKLLGMIVGNFETKFILHGHDDLYVI